MQGALTVPTYGSAAIPSGPGSLDKGILEAVPGDIAHCDLGGSSVKIPGDGQHPRQTLPMMARAFRSAHGTASGTRKARGGVRPRWRMTWFRPRGARTALRLRRGIRTSRFSGLTGPIKTPPVLGLDGPTGAKVEDVALGLRAFKVVTAEGAALGLCALGLMADAAALGLAELG